MVRSGGLPLAPAHAVDELDLAAKALMREDPVAFARLALGRGARIRSARAEDVEVPALARRVDKVLRVRLEGARGRLRVHVEVAASWASALPRRVYEYRTLLRRGGEPVESVVLCLKRGRKQREPVGRYDERGRVTTLRFTFPVICLWRLTERQLRALGPAFLPFVPYARDASPARVERTLEELSHVQPLERRADYQSALIVFAGNVFPAIDWRSRIPPEVLVQNPVIKAMQREAEVRLLARMLRRRLGAVAARPYAKRLGGASSRTISRVEKLITMPTDAATLTLELDRLLPAG